MIGGIGADFMAEVSGYNNNAQPLFYLQWNQATQQWGIMNNGATAAASGQQLEAKLEFAKFKLDSLPTERMYIEMRDSLGSWDSAQ
jgi:hypothetical protein